MFVLIRPRGAAARSPRRCFLPHRGWLEGLCGSLAVYLAQHGAKHLISLSRSGYGDERSQGYVKACAALGCQIYEAKVDVANLEGIRKVFRDAAADCVCDPRFHDSEAYVHFPLPPSAESLR